MKNLYKYILPIIMVVLLCGYSAWKLNDVEVPVAPTTIGVERSFVWINSDSLATCIVKTYTSDVKVSKGRKEFTVEYPSNKLILMHNVSEGAKADLDSLKLYAKDHFKCKEDNNSVKITLTVEDGFVCCPTALLLPLLDDNKNNYTLHFDR